MGEAKNRQTRGDRIRQLRKGKGLTQAQLAASLGITVTFVSLLESDAKTPSRDLLFRLAEVLGSAPEYVETGRATIHQEAERARLTYWPQLAYVAANYVQPGLLLESESIVVHDGIISTAVEKAKDSAHFCEFLGDADAASPDAQAIDNLLKSCAGGVLHPPTFWLDLLQWWNAAQRYARWEQEARPKWRVHVGLGGGHAAECHAADDRDCFDIESRWAVPLTAKVNQGPECEVALFEHAVRRTFVLNDAVQKCFPDVFWAMARTWSQRRLSAWLRFLRLPIDLYNPLAQIARAAENPAEFRGSSTRLLRQTEVKQNELLVSIFPFVYIRSKEYAKKYQEGRLFAVSLYGHVWDESESELQAHARLRGQFRSQKLLNWIFRYGEPETQKEVEALLAKKAPPHHFPGEDSDIFPAPPLRRKKRTATPNEYVDMSVEELAAAKRELEKGKRTTKPKAKSR